MTREEKELLLKDLCARLPYGLKYNFDGYDGCNYTMGKVSLNAVDDFPIENIKPYLFPMSSMTDKELIEFFQIRGMNLNTYELRTFRRRDIAIASTLSSYSRHIDWLNARHLDYRGLIEKGLAIDASGLNIY